MYKVKVLFLNNLPIFTFNNFKKPRNQTNCIIIINRYTWIKAEKLERVVASKLGSVSVLNGVVYSNRPKTIGRNKIAVPSGFWKMLFNKEKKYERCFYYENTIGLKTKGDKLRNHEVECKSLY